MTLTVGPGRTDTATAADEQSEARGSAAARAHAAKIGWSRAPSLDFSADGNKKHHEGQGSTSTSRRMAETPGTLQAIQP